jgi:hypothetical protein
MTTKLKTKPMEKHVDRTTTTYTGPVKVDATAVASLLLDLPPGARQGLRTPGPGIDAVVAELAASVPTDGAAAGISPAIYAAFAAGTTSLAQLTALWQTADKLAEVLGETIAILQDTREQQLSQMADAVSSTAKRTKNEGIKAPFQKTLAYKGQSAKKSAQTRAKNKATAAGVKAAATPAPTASGTRAA